MSALTATRVLIVLLMGSIASLCSGLTSTATTLTSSLNPSIYGQAVTFTATVSPAPPNGETITFKQGSTVLGTGSMSNGTATYTTSTLAAGGTDNIKAVYGGDSTYSGSTSATLEQVVNKATTVTMLTASPTTINVGQSVTFTSTVSPQYGGTVTGNVAFYDGSTKLKSVAISGGTASYTTSTLKAGTHSISGVYGGSNSYLTSTSGTITVTVGTGTYLQETMTWDNVTRNYQVFVPAVLPANPPLLLMLHGTSYGAPPYTPSTREWNWESVADQYGFIVAQPASTYNETTNAWNWNSYFMDAAFTSAEIGTCVSPPASACPDDAGFLRQLIVNLSSQYNVNPNMVFVTGFSSGAQMTERAGVELSDVVAAIAPTSGQMEGQQAAPPPALVPGNSVGPIAVQEWHGTLDTELPPCNYGTTKYSNVTFYLDTVDDTFNYWVSQNQCSSLQTTETLCTNGQATSGLSGNVATNCVNSNVEVQFIWEEGVAHTWESKDNTSRWLFLSAHPKPAKANANR